MNIIRPKLHYAPARNWMNDPNGTFFDGKLYHLFFQYNPKGANWGNICWNYATSPDLINWTTHGVKLSPDPALGEQYCFSGGAIKLEDRVKIFYSSIGFGEQAVRDASKVRILDCSPDFSSMKRVAVVDRDKTTPYHVYDWRDPFVFEFKGKYYMVIAGESDEHGNGILLYRAKDAELNSFEFVSCMYGQKNMRPETPNVAVFDDRIVLIWSEMLDHTVRYVCGKFDGVKLDAEFSGLCDYATNAFYATNLFKDDEGYVLVGWHGESLFYSDSPDGVHSGCLSLPRRIVLDEGRVKFIPMLGAFDGNKYSIGDHVARYDFAAQPFYREFGKAPDKLWLYCDGSSLTVKKACDIPHGDNRAMRMPVNGLVQVCFDGNVYEIFSDGYCLSGNFYGDWSANISKH